MNNNEFLPLYRDLMFKQFFGTNKYIYLTIYLLESLLDLPEGSLNGSTITNSVNLDKETIQNKNFELDVVLKSPNGDIYNIEMQTTYNTNSEIKNVMYVTKLFSEQLKIGETYNKIKPVTLINLVKDINIHKTGNIINKYVMTNTTHPSDKILEDYLTIYIINIDKTNEVSYNKNKNFEVIRNLLSAKSYEEMKNIVETSKNKLSDKLLKEMVNFMNNKEVQDYSRQEKLIRSNLITAKEEGRCEGKIEGKIEIAKKMLINNETLEKISLFTDLSPEEIKKLKEEQD